jgi:glycine/serine hydroxymethyltransferase
MKEKEMEVIADWIAQVVNLIKIYKLPETKEEKAKYLKEFREYIANNETIKKIKKEILEFGKKFPIPAI